MIAAGDTDPTEVIGKLWREVLKVPSVAAGDDFFAVGGHSMLATRLMSRLRTALGPGLPAGLVFEHPVFADLVAAVRGCLSAAAQQAGPVAAARGEGPVSLQQEELLRIEAVLGPSPLHNIVVPARTVSDVDAGVLRAALRVVLDRHPALRLRFPGTGRQVVGPPPAMSEVDLEVIDEPGDEAAIRRTVRRAHLRPFDLVAGNLVRAQLFRAAGGDLLVLHLHHLCVDGLSQSVLLDDLAEAYGALNGGSAPAPAEPGPDYLDYAGWQRAELPALLKRSRPHWRGVITTLAADRVPGERPGRAGRYHRAVATVPAETLAALRVWARPEGVTDFVACAAAVAAGVAKVTGRSRVGLGTLLDNRSFAAFEHSIGPFATSTLLAVDTGEAATGRKLALTVREQLRAARRFSDAPLAVLLDLPCAEHGLEPGELVDAVVVLDQPYQPAPESPLPLAPILDHVEPLVNAAVGAPLSVSLFLPEGGGLRVTAEVPGTDAADADALARALAGAVHDLATTPDEPAVTEPGAAVAR